ncbi:NUDIX domain-containing protein [Rhizobium sp. FY34]|uniref:NUDIX domain-containing protein n=1 Tax=Rhizobium sp. FY34 TaxID=2562309 RepID=UPI0010BF7B40|nr:NUDIX domain-containing protein [Rhizobium sp. FY34]
MTALGMPQHDVPSVDNPSTAPSVAMRPRPSASLILIDRSRACPHVFVGRRGSAHAFMPDLYVFPGGRRDRDDHALPYVEDLHPAALQSLLRSGPSRLTPAGARALALAALRELEEETGLSIARDDAFGRRAADLSSLRYLARAVTPPGAVRRFDNRFFATFVDEARIDFASLRESEELNDFRWLALDDLQSLRLPEILHCICADLKILLEAQSGLPFGSELYRYTNRNGQFQRSRL